jgi:hypothetical protein
MAVPVFEVAIGTVNGISTIFGTAAPYRPGSVQVFLNGQLKRQDFTDGWTELGAQQVQLNEAPEIGDVVQIYYVVA